MENKDKVEARGHGLQTHVCTWDKIVSNWLYAGYTPPVSNAA